MMVGINNELVPIYELIEDPDRAADLKEYIETGLVSDAEEIYYTTDLTHIAIPSLEKLTDTREKITSGLFKGGWRTTYPTQRLPQVSLRAAGERPILLRFTMSSRTARL